MGIKKNSFFSFSNDKRAFTFVEDLEDTETLEDFIASLDLPFEGEYQGEEYVIVMDNSNDFSEVYNVISTNKDLHVQDESTANDDEARFKFKGGDYEVGLFADFNDDYYKMVVSRA